MGSPASAKQCRTPSPFAEVTTAQLLDGSPVRSDQSCTIVRRVGIPSREHDLSDACLLTNWIKVRGYVGEGLAD